MKSTNPKIPQNNFNVLYRECINITKKKTGMSSVGVQLLMLPITDIPQDIAHQAEKRETSN